MENVLAVAKVEMEPEQLAALMESADTDLDGEISFEEFIDKLQYELNRGESGGLGLSTIVDKAGSVFSWLNPLEWFSKKDVLEAIEKAPPLPPPVVPKLVDDAPLDDATPVSPGDQKPARRVRSQKAILSEYIVKQRNSLMADEQRTAERRMAEFKHGQQDQYCAYTKRKIQIFQQAEIDRVAAAEALAAEKRETGNQMRIQLQAAYQQVQSRAQKRAETVSANTLRVRQLKKAEVEQRHEENRKHGHMVALQAAEERRLRKEQSLATVRAQQQAARDFAAKVRHETRPAVRKETREFFQARRNAVCAHERAMRAEGRVLRDEETDRFLQKAMDTVEKTRSVSGQGVKNARQRLKQKHQQEAEEVRQQLQEEWEKGMQREESLMRERQQKHEAAMLEKYNPNEHETGELREMMRQSLEVGRPAWSHALYEC